jgi:uncharacterized protein
MHGMGAIRGWMQVDHPDKWLRWHPWQEWYDLWGNPQAEEELFAFMDHYLHGKDNGWKKTPRVRMAILRFGEQDAVLPQSYENVIEAGFPIPRTEYRRMFFTASNELNHTPPPTPSVLSYDSETAESVSFSHIFPSKTRLVGLPKAVLYMSCPDHDDMDVYIQLEKLSKTGEPMTNLNVPWQGLPVSKFSEFKPEQATEVVQYRGPIGILRASQRHIDEAQSMHPHWPFHPHDREERVPPGTIVKLDIGIWAFGIEYEAGEGIRVQISGRTRSVDNFGTLEHLKNKGMHKVHVGGETSSYVILPYV